MRLAHSETTPWTPVPPVRGGTIEFKTMLEGDENTPDNYQLLLANTDVSFKSPRHRHNFDQLHFRRKARPISASSATSKKATWPTFPR